MVWWLSFEEPGFPRRNRVCFFLWGLVDEVRWRGQASSRARMLRYPYSCPLRDLKKVIRLTECATYRVALFPCGPQGPLSRSALGADAVTGGGLRWRTFSVEGLVLSPAEAVAFLCGRVGCPVQEEVGEKVDFRLGDDVRVWARAVLLVLELLARGRFVPVVGKVSSGGYRGRWRLVFSDADTARLNALAVALPRVVLALPPRGGGRPSSWWFTLRSPVRTLACGRGFTKESGKTSQVLLCCPGR